MEESYAAVGDTADLIASCWLREKSRQARAFVSTLVGEWMVQRILPLAGMDDQARRSNILAWWEELETNETFILNKLLTGSLRVGVSETLVYRAVAAVFSLSPAVIASGLWEPGNPAPSSFSVLVRRRKRLRLGRGPTRPCCHFPLSCCSDGG